MQYYTYFGGLTVSWNSPNVGFAIYTFDTPAQARAFYEEMTNV